MKNRIKAVAFAAVIFMLCLPCFAFSASAANYTSADLTSLARQLLAYKGGTFDIKYDMNGDKQLNLKDLLWLKKQIALDEKPAEDEDELEIDINSKLKTKN